MSERSSVAAYGDESGPLVQAEKLVKRFGDFEAVRGIDLEVRRGEFFGFLGPNGAGKSSTMRMIASTSPRSEGRLSVLGMDPDRDGPRIRARLGVVPQQDTLDVELTVRQNLQVYGRYFGLSRATARAKAEELLDFAQLTDRADAEVESLSGGMKRRLTIARSLVNDPELILLDEPTTGLDPQARHLLWDKLFRLKSQGVTLLVTTHYMDEAEQLADDVAIIDAGRVVAQGSPEELCRGGAENTLRFSGRPGLDVASLLKALPSDASAAEVTPGSYRVTGKVDPQLLATVTSWCAQHGVLPDRISVERHTLEDVFLELTGKELRS